VSDRGFVGLERGNRGGSGGRTRRRVRRWRWGRGGRADDIYCDGLGLAANGNLDLARIEGVAACEIAKVPVLQGQ